MELKIVAFGIAKDIIGNRVSSIRIDGNETSLGDLRDHLFSRYPEFKELVSLKFAVNDEYQADDFLLIDGVEVVLIPPVAGG